MISIDSIIKDSSAGSFYTSSTIANLFEKPPLRRKTKWIEMMMNATTRKIEIYEATIENLSRNFAMEVEISKVEQKVLLTLGLTTP